MSEVKIEESWKKVLAREFEKPYFKELSQFVRDEYQSQTVYPPPKFVFHAFSMTPFEDVRVVILGQDPYINKGEAHGMAFSVQDGVRIPPSLQNIYKEIHDDLGIDPPTTGNLDRWAKQGVLLLNATLTVRAKQSGSHQHKGWEEFTDAVIQHLSDDKKDLVFLLWGKYAQEKGERIDEFDHLVLRAAHPSPFSANNGFFGCKHFSKTNKYLEEHGKEPIQW